MTYGSSADCNPAPSGSLGSIPSTSTKLIRELNVIIKVLLQVFLFVIAMFMFSVITPATAYLAVIPSTCLTLVFALCFEHNK